MLVLAVFSLFGAWSTAGSWPVPDPQEGDLQQSLPPPADAEEAGVCMLSKRTTSFNQPSSRTPEFSLPALKSTALELLTGWEPFPIDQKMKVVYGVFTSPLPQYAEEMKAVEETWAQKVPPQKLLVVGVNGSTPGITYKHAPMCKDGHATNPGISCKEATILTTGYEMGADWVIVAGSDNYVFPRNLEQRLESEDSKKAQILGIYGCGGDFCEDHKTGLCGGGGYAISRRALDKMVGQGASASMDFIQESMHTASTVSGYWSDQVTSCIARRNGVKEVDLPGLYGWRLGPEDSFDEETYKTKIMATDPKPFTFHYVHPHEMHQLHKLVNDIDMSTEGVSRAVEGSLLSKPKSRKKHAVSLLGTSAVDASYEVQRAAYVKKMNEERARR